MELEPSDSKQRVPSTNAYWNFLLAACASPTQGPGLSLPPALAQNAADWNTFVSIADFHGVSALAFKNLARGGDAPSPLLDLLRQRYESGVQTSLILARELIRILESADSLKIELIPHKGIVLSELLYDDMALRPGADIDLLVRRTGVLHMKDALTKLGYLPRIMVPKRVDEDYLAVGYEYAFDSARRKNLLELQWAVLPHFFAVDYPINDIFERAETAAIAGRPVRSPAREDLLLLLCLHAAKHLWARLIWLCDIAQILNLGGLNWDVVLSAARRLGILRILHVTMLLTERLLSAPVPVPVQAGIAGDSAATRIAQEIIPDIANCKSWPDDRLAYFRRMAQLRERPIDRLRFFSRLALTPGPGEWQCVELPRRLAPLYRVVRIARLLRKFYVGRSDT